MQPGTVQRSWFGREPALVISTVSVILTALVTFGIPGLTDGLAAAIVAVLVALSGFLTALNTRPVAPSIATGLILAMVSLVAAFGVDIPQQWTGAAVMVIQALVTLIVRGDVTPVKVIDGTAVPVLPAERSSDPIATRALVGR